MQTAIRIDCALPTMAFAMPPPFRRGDSGSLVKKFQSSDCQPFTPGTQNEKQTETVRERAHTREGQHDVVHDLAPRCGAVHESCLDPFLWSR